jgi:putative ABC transport system ATP-binding protein
VPQGDHEEPPGGATLTSRSGGRDVVHDAPHAYARAMTTSTKALVTHGLRKTFEATEDEQIPVRALRGLDIAVGRGEFVAVMGPSGCGKSTMLNLVAGLDVPTDGTIEVDGEPITGLSEDQLAVMRRRHIGIVFQFFNLLEGMSVLENVAMPAAVAGRSRRQAETRARDLLDLLGIADKASAAPGRLSGGQRQRLSIARALANEPTLLLADEPTGSLDSVGGTEVLELFRRLHEGGQTIVMVTHDDDVASVSDRIVHMRDGRLDEGREHEATAAPGGVFASLEEPVT